MKDSERGREKYWKDPLVAIPGGSLYKGSGAVVVGKTPGIGEGTRIQPQRWIRR